MVNTNRQRNDVLQLNGHERTHDETLVQWQTEKDCIAGLLNRYSRPTISAAFDLLFNKNFLTEIAHHFIRENGTPDRTRHFIFNADVVNRWLETEYSQLDEEAKNKALNIANQSKVKNIALEEKDQSKKVDIAQSEKSNNGHNPQCKKSDFKHIQTNKDIGLYERENARENEPPSSQQKTESPSYSNRRLEPQSAQSAKGTGGRGEVNAGYQRGPFTEGADDARYHTEHFKAVCEACQMEPEALTHSMRAKVAVAAVTLFELNYSAEQIRLFGQLWPHETAPYPSQIQNRIKAILNRKDVKAHANTEHSNRDIRNQTKRQRTAAILARLDAEAERELYESGAENVSSYAGALPESRWGTGRPGGTGNAGGALGGGFTTGGRATGRDNGFVLPSPSGFTH